MVMSVEERRARLRGRQEESSKDRGQRGLGKALKVPLDLSGRDITWFNLKVGRNLVDIVPFVVSREAYTKIRQFTGKKVNRQIGDWDYKLEIPVHTYVGTSKETVLCPREAFGQSCSICDDMFEAYRKKGTSEWNEKTEDFARSLQPQWRCVYIVYDYLDPDCQGFKLWDYAYKSFEEYLMEKAETSEEGYVFFSDPFDGRVLEIEGRKKAIGKNEYIEAAALKFLPRQDPYTEDDINNNYPLDQMLVITPPDEVSRIHYGMDDNTLHPQQDLPSRPPVSQQTEQPQRRPAPQRTPPANECPGGGKFGIDCHQLGYCQSECAEEKFNACFAEFEKRSVQAGQQEDPPQQQEGPLQQQAPLRRGESSGNTLQRRQPPAAQQSEPAASQMPPRRGRR